MDLIYWSGSAHSGPFSWYYYGRIETTVHPVHVEPSVIKWQAELFQTNWAPKIERCLISVDALDVSQFVVLYIFRGFGNVNGIPDQEKEGIFKNFFDHPDTVSLLAMPTWI